MNLLLNNYIEDKYNQIFNNIDSTKEKSKAKKDGFKYFISNTQYQLIKLDNLDVLAEVIRNIEFIHLDKPEQYYSDYETYCYNFKFYYTDKFGDLDDATKIDVALNEIVSSMVKGAPTTLEKHIENHNIEKTKILYHTGIIATEQKIDIYSKYPQYKEIINLSSDFLHVSPNPESLVKRYKDDKKKGLFQYYTINNRGRDYSALVLYKEDTNKLKEKQYVNVESSFEKRYNIDYYIPKI